MAVDDEEGGRALVVSEVGACLGVGWGFESGCGGGGVEVIRAFKALLLWV